MDRSQGDAKRCSRQEAHVRDEFRPNHAPRPGPRAIEAADVSAVESPGGARWTLLPRRAREGRSPLDPRPTRAARVRRRRTPCSRRGRALRDLHHRRRRSRGASVAAATEGAPERSAGVRSVPTRTLSPSTASTTFGQPLTVVSSHSPSSRTYVRLYPVTRMLTVPRVVDIARLVERSNTSSLGCTFPASISDSVGATDTPHASCGTRTVAG